MRGGHRAAIMPASLALLVRMIGGIAIPPAAHPVPQPPFVGRVRGGQGPEAMKEAPRYFPRQQPDMTMGNGGLQQTQPEGVKQKILTPELPPDWKAAQDTNGRTYYYSTVGNPLRAGPIRDSTLATRPLSDCAHRRQGRPPGHFLRESHWSSGSFQSSRLLLLKLTAAARAWHPACLLSNCPQRWRR